MPETQRQPKGTVVVVHDDEAARVSVTQMLRLRRYAVQAFSSAEARPE